jgi:hypothetical protein
VGIDGSGESAQYSGLSSKRHCVDG